jgi:hypothetical protein
MRHRIRNALRMVSSILNRAPSAALVPVYIGVGYHAEIAECLPGEIIEWLHGFVFWGLRALRSSKKRKSCSAFMPGRILRERGTTSFSVS